MRRGVTALVVVVVAAIALAAGVDALRGDDEPEPAAEPAPEQSSTSTAETPEAPPVEHEPVSGLLYYTDQDCRLQAGELPDLTPAEAPNWDECTFVLSPDGHRVAGAGSGWDPHSDPLRGRLFQSEDGMIQVATNAGPEGRPFRGRAPAWRPDDGTLTYFADGAIREWPSEDVVLSQRALLRAIARNTFVPLGERFRAVSVREAAWLDDRRLAVIMTGDADQDEDLLAVYEGDRLDALAFDEPGGFTNLRVSPRGRYVAAETSGRRGQGEYVILDDSGASIDTLGIRGYRAIAWSPDDRWAAIAADSGVIVFRPGNTGPPELELDIVAQDLDWRGEVGPPPLVDAGEVRNWLGRVGGTGRLLVTVPGCRLRALRLPDLVWDEEPDVPAPCKFTLTPNDVPLDEAVSVSPTGELRAACEGGGLRVFQNDGFRAQLSGACGPAWMGDGTLTFIRNGGLWRGIEDAHRLVSREQVGETFGRPSALEEVAWLDDERFWAVVRSGGGAIVALMSTANSLAFSPSFTTRAIEDLRVSASGMVAARTDQGVVFFDSGGRRALTFPNGRAVAWAPGELFAAVATPSEVLFVAPVSREVLPVSLEVSDVEWVVP
jgi:hypothetical protein